MPDDLNQNLPPQPPEPVNPPTQEPPTQQTPEPPLVPPPMPEPEAPQEPAPDLPPPDLTQEKAEEPISMATPKKPKVKIILTSLVAFLILASIPLGVYLVKQQQEMRGEAYTTIIEEPRVVCGKIKVSAPAERQTSCPKLTQGTQPGSCPNSGQNNITSYNSLFILENVTQTPVKVKYAAISDFCTEPYGQRDAKFGECHPVCYSQEERSEKEEEIPAGGSIEIPISRSVPETYGTACGTIQTDLEILAIDDNTSCNIPGGVAAGVCQTGLTCSVPTPTPTPQTSFSCQKMEANKNLSQLQKGENVTFTCTGTALQTTINHFEFRVSRDGGTPTDLGSVASSNNQAQKSYTVPDYGCYLVECRACSSADATQCTTWGKTQ